MSLNTALPFGSSQITEILFSIIGNGTKTESTPIETKKLDIISRKQSASISDFIYDLCLDDPRLDATISEGTKWVAKKFYGSQPKSFKKMRMHAGLTQAQLAKAIGTSQPYIAKLERGEINAGMDVIGRIAKAVSLEPKEAFELLFAEYEKKNV